MKIAVKFLFGLTITILFGVVVSQSAGAYPLNPQAPITIGGDMHMVDSADFNQDGNNDLVITDGKAIRGIGVLYGNGNGTFSTPVLIGDTNTYEYGLKVADLNNDSWIDIVVANGDQSQLQIYINDGTGAFLPEYYVALPSIGGGHGNLDIADVNGDGYKDLAVPANNDAFHLLINDTTGSFPTITSVAGSATSSREEVAFGDVNNDNRLDIVATAYNDGLVEIFYGDGSGSFVFDHNFSAIIPYGVIIKDINNDSLNEIIFTQQSAGQDVMITDEFGNSIYTIPAGSGVYVRSDDINADGLDDIIFSDQTVTGVKVALGNGAGFDTPVDYFVNYSPLGLTINDFDGDGLLDVAAVNHGETLSIFLTAAPPTTPGVTIIGSPVSEEGGANGQFQVVLDTNPTDTVFVTFGSGSGQSFFPGANTLCFVPTGANVNPGSPYDPCSTWNVGQTVLVGADDDGIVENTHSDALQVSLSSADPNYDNLQVSDVNATIYDNEVPVIPAIKIVTSATPDEANINEQGPTSDTFDVSLEGIPGSNVTISCTSSDAAQASFSPALGSYSVAPLTANLPREYTVTAVDDMDIEGSHVITVSCTTTSADPDFDGLTYQIDINISDNDLVDTDGDGDGDVTDPDDDGDNVSDVIEDAVIATDGNGDGIRDSLQANVTSSPNTVTGTYMTFVVAGGCHNIINYNTNPEVIHSTQDSPRDYPIGFNSFRVTCDSVGATANITWILDKVYDTSSWQYQKYYPGTGTYVTLPGVSYSTVTISGQTKTAVNYSVTDGSEYDIDGHANAEISDPNGPGLVVPIVADPSNLSNTGRNILVALISIFIAIVGLYVTMRKPSKSYKNIKRRSFHGLITNKFSKK